MFFYNLIDNPIRLIYYSDGAYSNIGGSLNSQGFESQIKLTVWKFTWFFGYTYTDAFINNGNSSFLNSLRIFGPIAKARSAPSTVISFINFSFTSVKR